MSGREELLELIDDAKSALAAVDGAVKDAEDALNSIRALLDAGAGDDPEMPSPSAERERLAEWNRLAMTAKGGAQ